MEPAAFELGRGLLPAAEASLSLYGSAPAAALCPLTLEPLRHPVLLRGSRFEAAALLAMLEADTRRVHPYERTPLLDAELEAIYRGALQDEDARLRLAELGWSVMRDRPRRAAAAAFGLGIFRWPPAAPAARNDSLSEAADAAMRARERDRERFISTALIVLTGLWVLVCVKAFSDVGSS
jgi:hypothetical protein